MNRNGWEKFAKYVGVQGVLALLATGVAIALLFLKVNAPKEAWGLLGVAWGFYSIKNGRNVIVAVRRRPL